MEFSCTARAEPVSLEQTQAVSAVSAVSQVAAAAAAGKAEGSQALSSLAQEAFSNSSATATAVHNCVYRPYIARQVGSVLHCRSLLHPMPQLAVRTQFKAALRSNDVTGSGGGAVPCEGEITLCKPTSHEAARAGC